MRTVYVVSAIPLVLPAALVDRMSTSSSGNERSTKDLRIESIGERGAIISGVCGECAISKHRDETCSNVDWAEMRAVYSSKARKVWVESDRLMVVMVG